MTTTDRICRCKDVTIGDVTEYVSCNPSASIEEVKEQHKIGQGCGRCVPEYQLLFKELAPSAATPAVWRLYLSKTTRIFHLFVSLAAAVFLLFFAISGYAMNHRDDLGLNDTVETSHTETIEKKLLESGNRDLLLEKMTRIGARGKLVEFDRSEGKLYIAFQSAGRYFEADIDLSDSGTNDATADICMTDSKFLETLGEIHRSKDVDGSGSSLFIDIMSILMGAVSLTGIGLFFCMASRRSIAGFACFAASCGCATLIYFILR